MNTVVEFLEEIQDECLGLGKDHILVRVRALFVDFVINQRSLGRLTHKKDKTTALALA